MPVRKKGRNTDGTARKPMPVRKRDRFTDRQHQSQQVLDFHNVIGLTTTKKADHSSDRPAYMIEFECAPPRTLLRVFGQEAKAIFWEIFEKGGKVKQRQHRRASSLL